MIICYQLTGYDSTMHDTLCQMGTFPYLDQFEADLNFISIRTVMEDSNCRELEQGVALVDLSETHIIDDVMATLISPDFRVYVDDTLFYWAADGLIYAGYGDNKEGRIDQVESGMTSTEVGQVENHLNNRYKKGDCDPSFTAAPDVNTSKISVQFTGGTNHDRITWEVSTGLTVAANTTSFDIPNVTPGMQVTITCTVKDEGDPDDKTDDCEESSSQTITMSSCVPLFTYNTGAGGSACFTDISVVSGGTITAWEWQINGQTYTTQNPCVTFPADCVYPVTLTITSSGCPGGTQSVTRDIEITSTVCCSKNGSYKQNKEYGTSGKDEILWKWNLGSDIIWDQRLRTTMTNYEIKNNGKRKKKATEDMNVDFGDNLYKPDQNNCTCLLTHPVSPSPSGNQPKAKKIVVNDALGGIKFKSRKKWSKISHNDPIMIDYNIDNTLIKQVNTPQLGADCD